MKIYYVFACLMFMLTSVVFAQEQEPISAYRENYILGGYDSSDLNKGAVMKFQLSVKFITFWDGLFIGYTQRSFMDVLADSFPFYDHNFAPEVFYRPEWMSKGALEYFQAGLLHESNGLSDVGSRSWNRLYLESRLSLGHFYLRPILWFPFLIDNTADMKKYYGYGEATLGFKTLKDIEMSLRGRVGEHFDKGNLMFNFSLPVSAFRKRSTETSYAQVWVQCWYGHGETLIGLEKKSLAAAVGIGFRPRSKKKILPDAEAY